MYRYTNSPQGNLYLETLHAQAWWQNSTWHLRANFSVQMWHWLTPQWPHPSIAGDTRSRSWMGARGQWPHGLAATWLTWGENFLSGAWVLKNKNDILGRSNLLGQRVSFCFVLKFAPQRWEGEKGGSADFKIKHTEPLIQEIPSGLLNKKCPNYLWILSWPLCTTKNTL